MMNRTLLVTVLISSYLICRVCTGKPISNVRPTGNDESVKDFDLADALKPGRFEEKKKIELPKVSGVEDSGSLNLEDVLTDEQKSNMRFEEA
ncbi:unnamed protein product [Anisakis simplex]|uniref:RxLR effector protein n=1 Tax=Anisakis simplex TaxID=6269 RepID=A0A0M3KG37_ANISI|nr:unnamed protein product [Anisakis simplex]